MAVKDINDFKEKAKKDINDIKNLAGDIVRIIGGGSENIKKELKKAVDSSVEKKKKSENRKKHLITSALPYVNNEPHLGNLLQVLSADVYARYSRLAGYETFYVCGTDEYGTATEIKALDMNMSPYDLCTKFHDIHKKIYSWFNISFDHFGRTSCPEHIVMTQEIFDNLDKNGFIEEGEITQYYCHHCKMYLADRYIVGECPKCGSEAKGDQCDNCGTLLDPSELINPRCSRCGNTPEEMQSKHLFINLPKALPMLEKWEKTASVKGEWANNAVAITEGWIKAGLKPRCITRDLKWGIPVNKKGYEDKVFYVWFDAPIAYISLTSTALPDSWKEWWQNPDNVELYQFIGKDNIPFHTVIFPISLLASGQNWTMLHHISSTEYLNYENGKFSKSRNVGVFGLDCEKTGIPADMWRFYLFYNRPEKGDYNFLWDDFEKKINGELVGNLSNLINRTLVFISKYMDGEVPTTGLDSGFISEIRKREEHITHLMDKVKEKDALHAILELSDEGNKYFQDNEPWKTVKTDMKACKKTLGTLAMLVRDLAIMIMPYMPSSGEKILSFLGEENQDWSSLGRALNKDTKVLHLSHVFDRLDHNLIERLKMQFAEKNNNEGEEDHKKGKQKGGEMIANENEAVKDTFRRRVTLKVAKITNIERHSGGDKLYILTLDAAEGAPRTIVSSIVPFYKEEELLGHNIIVVQNLKPANFRGVKSSGMLLAASDKNDEHHETCEVLFADNIPEGTNLYPEGIAPESAPDCYIKAEHFFELPLYTKNGVLCIDNVELKTTDGKTVSAHKYINDVVG